MQPSAIMKATGITKVGETTKATFHTDEEYSALKVDVARANLAHEKREWMAKAMWDFDVEITNMENQLELVDGVQEFDHAIYNNNSFPIAVRIMASGSGRLKTKKPFFFIDSDDCHSFAVSVKPVFPDRSERVVLEMLPINEEDQRMCAWRMRPDNAFQTIFQPVKFTIRYRKVPLWSTMFDAAMKTNFELNKNTMDLVEKMYANDLERDELIRKAKATATSGVPPQDIVEAKEELEANYGNMHYVLSLDLAINHQDDQKQLQRPKNERRMFGITPEKKEDTKDK